MEVTVSFALKQWPAHKGLRDRMLAHYGTLRNDAVSA